MNSLMKMALLVQWIAAPAFAGTANTYDCSKVTSGEAADEIHFSTSSFVGTPQIQFYDRIKGGKLSLVSGIVFENFKEEGNNLVVKAYDSNIMDVSLTYTLTLPVVDMPYAGAFSAVMISEFSGGFFFPTDKEPSGPRTSLMADTYNCKARFLMF